MAIVRVHLVKQDADFHFLAENENGHRVDMDDGTAYDDGRGNGASPMQLLVMAIGACSGIDIVSILKKGRQRIEHFEIDVTGEKPDGVAPSVYESVHVHFRLDGELDPARVRRAIDLSMEKYCSVARVLEKTARITFDYRVNGEAFEGSGV